MLFPDTTGLHNITEDLLQNKLILDELNYDRVLLEEQLQEYLLKMTTEQRGVYDRVIDAANSDRGQVFFLYGHGGTGKTFVWNALAARLRSKGKIVLIVASSGIASLLLPGGRTAHSRFAIPLELDECSTCNIKQRSALADLIEMTKLIIWDEAPMMSKYCFESLDRTMRDLLGCKNDFSSTLPFGGKTIVFGGDFRQILPVVTKGSRQDIVNALINSSYLWDACTVLKLTKNMRLTSSDPSRHQAELRQFAKWILAIGDGKLGIHNDVCSLVTMPSDILLSDYSDPIEAICNHIYGDYIADCSNTNLLQGRAILAPTINIVDQVNNYMLSLNNNEVKTYLSSNSTCFQEGPSDMSGNVHSDEFLASVRSPSLPNHELSFKEGCPVMLIRNIDHSAGLCNGTRLTVTRLGEKLIEARVLCGSNMGDRVFIPCLTLTPSDKKIPFKFQRRQFPLVLSYAMTINKSQGQSLSQVGLLLKQPVFTHGQLYVALSRVTNKQGLKIVIDHEDSHNSTMTNNIVYREVFRNV